LKDHLRQAGNIYRVEIPEYEDGRSKGFAIATFYSEEDAKNAIRMFDKTDFNGREINVRYDRFRRWNAPGYQQAPQQWIQPLQENATSIGNSSQIAEQQDMPGQAESTAVPMDFVTVQQTQMQQFQQLSGNNAAVSMPRAPVESVAPGELPGQTHMPTPHDSEPSDTTSHISGGQGTAHTT
jgi:RNA recognition motif-containing protein